MSNFKSPITYTFVKCGCSIYFFLKSANLICRSTDISKYFRESLGVRDNESRLYLIKYILISPLKYRNILGTKLLSSLEQQENAVSLVQFLDHHFEYPASISSVKDRQHFREYSRDKFASH